jgi:hypothetical protein
MEPHSRQVEDSHYLKEILFGNARTGGEFNESFRKSGSVIAFPGVFGGWMEDGVKGYMKENPVKGKIVTWGSFTNGIENKRYFNKIDETVKKYPNSVILAYSAAGLSLLLWADRNQAWDSFNKIITIGTPFRGAQTIKNLVKFLSFFGQTFKDVAPNSGLIDRVNKIVPPDGKVISIFGIGDEFTPNPKDLKLNWPKLVLDAESHGDLQNHGAWIANILDVELGINHSPVTK